MICIKVNLLVKSCLRNEKKEYNIKGIYSNKVIKFIEDDTLMVIDLNNNTLERSKDDYKIKLDFKNNLATISQDNININIDINVLNIKVLDDYFYVKYKLEFDYFEFEISIIDN